MLKTTFDKAWTHRKNIASLGVSGGLALLLIGPVKSGINALAHNGHRLAFAKVAPVQNLKDASTALPETFTATVTLEDPDDVATKSGLTFKADFVGKNSLTFMFADIIVSREGRGIASYRLSIGSSFEIPLGGKTWLRITLEDIDYLPPIAADGESDDFETDADIPSKLNVILLIEKQAAFP